MQVIRNEPDCQTAGCHAGAVAAVDAGRGRRHLFAGRGRSENPCQRDPGSPSCRSAFVLLAAACVGAARASAGLHSAARPRRRGQAARRRQPGPADPGAQRRRARPGGRLLQRHDRRAAGNRSRSCASRRGHLEQKVEERTLQLRAAEAEAHQREKLAAVGLLASGVAHEINNPLTGVLTFSHLIRQKMPDGSADAEDMDLVIRETRRCAEHRSPPARLRPPEVAGSALRRSQRGDRGRRAVHRALGAPAQHRHDDRPRPRPAAGVDRRGPGEAGHHEHPGERAARDGERAGASPSAAVGTRRRCRPSPVPTRST